MSISIGQNVLDRVWNPATRVLDLKGIEDTRIATELFAKMDWHFPLALDVSNCKWFNDAFARENVLGEPWKHLERLSVAYCAKLGHDGLRHMFKYCRNLKSIDLTDKVDLADDAMEQRSFDWLNDLLFLRTLIAQFMDLMDTHLETFGTQLSRLETLSLRGNTHLTNHSLKSLGCLKHLQRLNISDCGNHGNLFGGEVPKITDAGVIPLIKALGELRSFKSNLVGITDASLKTMGDKLELLEELDVGANPGITGEGFANWSARVPLRKLWVNQCPLTSFGILKIGEITSLKYLDLSYTQNTDCEVDMLSNLRSLEYLNLSGCKFITPGFVEGLLGQLPAMKGLDVTENAIRYDDLQVARHRFPGVRIRLGNDGDYTDNGSQDKVMPCEVF